MKHERDEVWAEYDELVALPEEAKTVKTRLVCLLRAPNNCAWALCESDEGERSSYLVHFSFANAVALYGLGLGHEVRVWWMPSIVTMDGCRVVVKVVRAIHQ